MAKRKSTKTSTNGSKPNTQKSEKATNSSNMKTSEIRDLIEFISTTGLNEVDIETSELKLHVKREPDQKILKSSAPVAAVAPVAVAAPAAVQPAAPKAPVKEEPSSATTIEIKSPMIGTLYRSANPESANFVSVGDKISKGQTLCIIEAMKLFNEIESEVSGTIIKVMVENASPVEYDQVLFIVEPD